MSVTLEFSPDVEAWFNARAKEKGVDLAELVRQMAEENLVREEIKDLKTPDGHWNYKRFLALPSADRTRLLEYMAKEAAPLYAADLALPPYERELTAFEVLNDYDPIYDSVDEYYSIKASSGKYDANN